MEAMSLEAVFGERIRGVPISSNKSMIGHTLTSSGAIEAVFSVQTMQSGVIPPTINYKVPDPTINLDVVPNVAREAAGRHGALQLLRLRRPERLPDHRRRAGVSAANGRWRASMERRLSHGERASRLGERSEVRREG